MTITKAGFEKLIRDIQSQQTEWATLDCKEDLSLDQDGDKASFIRDVAALANNVTESYLVIGIRNKTWEEIGLIIGSPLLNSDQTQSRMNQILEKRLDPQISIRYQVVELHDKSYGVVSVNGKDAPYIVAIDDVQYGGNRTKGSAIYINRGVVYARQGDTTIAVNRQSRIRNIIDLANGQSPDNPKGDSINEFLSKNNYIDVDNVNFAHNSLTGSLVELVREEATQSWTEKPAKSWVSFVYLPVKNQCKLDTASLFKKLQPGNRKGRDGQWFHGLPSSISNLLHHASGNPRLFWSRSLSNNKANPEACMYAISIHPTGEIQLVVTYPLFCEINSIRCYSFINLIGFFWQLTYLARAIYADADYDGEILCQLNLVGTHKTRLVDFALGWGSPFDDLYPFDVQEFTDEQNIVVRRNIKLVSSNDEEIEQLVRNSAIEIGKYYGQETPYCFTPKTGEFPIREYLRKNSY